MWNFVSHVSTHVTKNSTNRTRDWNQLIYWVRWQKQVTWKMLFPTKAIFIQLVITNHTSAREAFHFVRFLYSSFIFNIPNKCTHTVVCVCVCIYIYIYISHHHVPEGLGVFPVPWSSRWRWSLHLFLGRPMFLRPFGLYCSVCLVVCLCPSSVHVVATFSGTVLFPLLCSVLPFFG